MPNSKRFFSSADLEAIEKEVALAESGTSGEIVPFVVEESDSYLWVHWVCGVIGMAFATLALWIAQLRGGWGVELGSIVSWQVAGAALGGSLSFIPGVKRRLIPKAWMAGAVHRECMAQFLALGLYETRDRTGVLIYLSLFEHRVEILADRGIHEKAGETYWESQIKALVQAIKRKQAPAGLREAIHQIGMKLAKDFPARPDDVNEHLDGVRFGRVSRTEK